MQKSFFLRFEPRVVLVNYEEIVGCRSQRVHGIQHPQNKRLYNIWLEYLCKFYFNVVTLEG